MNQPDDASTTSRDEAADSAWRGAFGALADELIPSATGHLSATEAGVAGAGLDFVLTTRPDLCEALGSICRSWEERGTQALLSMRPDDFDTLSFAVVTAYFANPRVRASYGYHGNLPELPAYSELTPAELDDLLAPVRQADRGASGRATPNRAVGAETSTGRTVPRWQ